VKVWEVARPEALVVSLSVAVPPANVPDAPEPGAVKVTETPGTALPYVSLTVAFSALLNAVLIAVDCPDPAVAVTVAAAPGLLVRLKFVDDEPAVAVTV
jgi:hypothetical protein